MKKHRLTALAASLCLLCTGLPAAGLPATEITAVAAAAKLTFGDYNYTVEDGNAVISAYNGTDTVPVIPTEIDGMPVTAIGSTCFYKKTITEIVIPEGITSIASGAFWHCKSLAKVTFPSTLTTLEAYAFADCPLLETIDLPKSVTYIGNKAFDGTGWMTAELEKGDFVVINGILLDATGYVEGEMAKRKERREQIVKEYEESLIWHRSSILTNQVGYFEDGLKQATLLSDASAPVAFELLDEGGNAVFTGESKPFGPDVESGDTVHILDFTAFKTPGTYTLKAGDATSRDFKIGITEDYSGMLYDGLNYFYQARSGIAIEEQYITSGDAAALARKAAHAPDIASIVPTWDSKPGTETQDVTGGWYDAGDHGKYTVNAGISLWLLQNQYERALLKGTDAAYADGAMSIPENSNGLPDLLDEARWEMEWMLKMVVLDGDYKDMAYHKMHDIKWTALGLDPANDLQQRVIMPPTTAATLNVSACAAQAYRLWKDLDPDFGATCLDVAKRTYEAAKAHPDMYAPGKSLIDGGGMYNDIDVTDEFYWAAAELYAATGDKTYHDEMTENARAYTVQSKMGGISASFDWGTTATLGSMTLLLDQEGLSEGEVADIQGSLISTADEFVSLAASQGYGLPFHGEASKSADATTTLYPWGSNSFVADNAIVLAYAYDLTQDQKYLDGVTAAMDYLLGRNPMDLSYVTGYGDHTSQYPHHRWWAIQINDAFFPKAPCGVLVGGPNSGMEDNMAKLQEWTPGVTAPQTMYIDDINAYSVNEVTINWNSPLTWVTGFLCEQNGGISVGHASTGTQMPEPDPLPEEEDLPIVVPIPEGVTIIGEQIFGSVAGNVTEVTLPAGVTHISKEAFYRCTKLDTLELPATIEEVGDEAFAETPWLAAKLAESPLLIINGLLIDGSTAEGDVAIPDGVTAILGNAFALNKGITGVTIPEGVTKIGAGAFSGCSSLATLTLPETLRSIGKSAFDGTALTELTIPAGVRDIGTEAFVNNTSLHEVTVLADNAAIGQEAFGCTSVFTANGQYSYIFVHGVLDDFTVACHKGSKGDAYATQTGVKVRYLDGAAAGLCGDIDGSGEIDIFDAIAINKALLGGLTLSPEAKALADVDQNGAIDTTDALNILKAVVKLVTLPV